MRTLRTASTLVVPLLLLGACGVDRASPPIIDSAPVGSASAAVSCTGPVGEHGETTGVYDDGEAFDEPDAAVAEALGQIPLLVDAGDLRPARLEDDRQLFTYEVDGRTVMAVVVKDGPTIDDDGWYVESWARCDLAELPRAVAEAYGTQVWTDTSGTPVDTRTISSYTGPEHCDWQDMTFLELGRSTYVRNPDPELSRDFVDEDWDPATTLPRDAGDTGYERDGEHLWLSADRTRAYVGDRRAVEMWPRERQPLGCA